MGHGDFPKTQTEGVGDQISRRELVFFSGVARGKKEGSIEQLFQEARNALLAGHKFFLKSRPILPVQRGQGCAPYHSQYSEGEMLAFCAQRQGLLCGEALLSGWGRVPCAQRAVPEAVQWRCDRLSIT